MTRDLINRKENKNMCGRDICKGIIDKEEKNNDANVYVFYDTRSQKFIDSHIFADISKAEERMKEVLIDYCIDLKKSESLEFEVYKVVPFKFYIKPKYDIIKQEI